MCVATQPLLTFAGSPESRPPLLSPGSAPSPSAPLTHQTTSSPSLIFSFIHTAISLPLSLPLPLSFSTRLVLFEWRGKRTLPLDNVPPYPPHPPQWLLVLERGSSSLWGSGSPRRSRASLPHSQARWGGVQVGRMVPGGGRDTLLSVSVFLNVHRFRQGESLSLSVGLDSNTEVM